MIQRILALKHFVERNKKRSIAIGFLLWILFFGITFHEDPIVSPVVYYIYSSLLYLLFLFGLRKLVPLIQRDYFPLYFILAMAVAIVIALFPVMFHLGWPLNHDHLTWKIHTRTWAAHISQFDLIPLWSSRDGAGMGVPTPLYYHKLFYIVSSFFYILSGKIKWAIVLSLISFMAGGIIGVYQIGKKLGNRKWISLLVALSFVLLNYTLTNWYLRGAMAEFSAMMLVPFLFLEELKLIQSKKYSYRLGLIIFLLAFSHSVIGYYSAFTVLAALMVMAFKVNRKEAFGIVKGLTISALSIVAVYLIYIIPMVILSDDFNPSKIKDHGSLPQYSILEFGRYWYDLKYEWFSKPYYGYTVQFDLPVLGFVLIAFGIFIAKYKSIQAGIHRITSFKTQAIVFILLLNVFFIALQTKIAIPFYENVPGADYIQFPWRLLSFIQLLYLMLLFWFLSYLNVLKNKKIPIILTGSLLAILIISYPGYWKTEYKWYKNSEVEAMVRRTCNVGEYLPSMTGTKTQFLFDKMYLLSDRNIEIKEEGNFVGLRNQFELYSEALHADFYAEIKRPTEVILPITYSELSRMFLVDTLNDTEAQIPIYRTDKDPRVRTFLTNGNYELRLDLPAIKNLFIPKVGRREKEPLTRVECNAEMLSISNRYFVSNDRMRIITGSEFRSDEKARSGKYSVKLFGADQFGFGYEVKASDIYGKKFRLSVWRNGAPGAGLVIEAAGRILKREEKVIEKDSLGWERLLIDYALPPDIEWDEMVNFYVHRSDKDAGTYFDDFLFEIIGEEGEVWHTTRKGIDQKSLKEVVFDIKNNEVWLESVRKQAIERNISLDSNIMLNALYYIEQQELAKQSQ